MRYRVAVTAAVSLEAENAEHAEFLVGDWLLMLQDEGAKVEYQMRTTPIVENPENLELSLYVHDPGAVIDAVNEVLRELSAVGAIDDSKDDGWAWSPLP